VNLLNGAKELVRALKSARDVQNVYWRLQESTTGNARQRGSAFWPISAALLHSISLLRWWRTEDIDLPSHTAVSGRL
jgi:hypothetical protein